MLFRLLHMLFVPLVALTLVLAFLMVVSAPASSQEECYDVAKVKAILASTPWKPVFDEGPGPTVDAFEQFWNLTPPQSDDSFTRVLGYVREGSYFGMVVLFDEDGCGWKLDLLQVEMRRIWEEAQREAS